MSLYKDIKTGLEEAIAYAIGETAETDVSILKQDFTMDDVIKNLYTLFNAAWNENNSGRGTDITRMVTTFVPDAIQNLQAYKNLNNNLR